MTAYYNEIDPYAAQWLRNLIAENLIAPGVVDERSVSDVRPADLAGFVQCHFFAGIGGWSYAARLAGWPDTRPLWTGSCPCQPFSIAGRQLGTADERHLWPHWFHLISVCEPDVIFGEQVEAAIAHGWLDLVQDDLEGKGYAFAAVDFPAASVGAPHIRQRLRFVAHHHYQRRGDLGSTELLDRERSAFGDDADRCGETGELGNTHGGGGRRNTGAVPREESGTERRMRRLADRVESAGADGVVGNNNNTGSQGRSGAECSVIGTHGQTGSCGSVGELEIPKLSESTRFGQLSGSRICQQEATRLTGSSGVSGWWGDAEWIWCADQKYRPVEPGTFPLAHGVSARVGRLRAYGNAVVPQAEAELIRAYMECAP